MTTQPDLFSAAAVGDLPSGVTEADQDSFRYHLMIRGWQTRREVSIALGWDDRKIRSVAESLGTDVVRCQLGYKLTDDCTREDVSAAVQGCDAFESQAKKALTYSQGLRRRLHAIVG